MRWEAVARRTPSERRQEERRRVGCCGCGRKPPLLSKAAIAAATAAYDAGDWPGAMKAYDHALMMMTTTEVESRAKAHLVRCECFQQMHDFQSMEMEAEALLRTAGDTWSGFRMRGTARYQQGRREEALADFELALVHTVRACGWRIFIAIPTETDRAVPAGSNGEAGWFCRVDGARR